MHLISINSYVLVLLQYCLWFYIVSLGKRFYGERTSNLLLVSGIAVSSLVAYFCCDASGWCYERWGLVWGIFLFLFMPRIKQFVRPKTCKILFWGVLSIVFGIAYLRFKPVFFIWWIPVEDRIGISYNHIAFYVVVTADIRKQGNKLSWWNIIRGVSFTWFYDVAAEDFHS